MNIFKKQHFLNIFSLLIIFQLTPIFSEEKEKEQYRIFDDSSPAHVKEFYRLNHTYQTFDFVIEKEKQYLPLNRQKMGIWEAIELVDKIVDESDPDIDLPQCYHFYQAAEALRKKNYPRWLILTGFIHDLGKILTLYGEPQWAVVGDTFPVGCAYSDKVVFPEYFAHNPDINHEIYQTKYGIYKENCGFDRLRMSWGHDEYLYQVTKNHLPFEASYIIRFHSFYASHRSGAYEYFMNDQDKIMTPWLKLFSEHDLYSKSNEELDIEALKPYYEELIAEFFPPEIDW